MNEDELLNVCMPWYVDYKKWVSNRNNTIFKDPIKYYCGFGYKAINRNCLESDDHHTIEYRRLLKECADDLEYWLKKAPILEKDIVLYRVVDDVEFKQLRKLKKINYSSFLSTTIISNRDVLKKIFYNEYVFEIRVPKGTICAYIEPLSSTGQKREKEVLFPRNTVLSLTSKCSSFFCRKELKCTLKYAI